MNAALEDLRVLYKNASPSNRETCMKIGDRLKGILRRIDESFMIQTVAGEKEKEPEDS